ncbi:MAG: YciK family oxidoreductase [Gammaproteobacteria bacterium]
MSTGSGLGGKEYPTGYCPPADLLKNRVILITGAGGGIGGAVAKACAAHGASTVLLGKTVTRLERTYDEIEAQGHPCPALYPLDLEKAFERDFEALAQTIGTAFGRLDAVVHNAAVLGELCPLMHYDLRIWGRVMQVNLHAPLLLTRACLSLLKEAEDASIVFTSDTVGHRARAYWGAYAVSKFALEGMMQVFADELEHNTRVRVNSIDPGPVRTRLRAAAYPAQDPSAWTEPEDVVLPYLFLLGPDSQHISGCALSAQPALEARAPAKRRGH